MPLSFLYARFSLPKCHFHPDLPVFLGLGLGGINGIYLTRVIGTTFGQKVGGLATSLYWLDGICRRLSWREAARTHSIPEPTIHVMEQFATSTIADVPQRENELLRFIGNSIPVLTLHDVVEHLLSLLNW